VVWSPLALLLFLFNFRIIKINERQIGHLVTDPMTIDLQNIVQTRKKYRYIILLEKNKVANNYVLLKLKSKFKVLDNPLIYKAMYPLKNHPFISTNSNLFKLYRIQPDRLFINIDRRESGYKFFKVSQSEVLARTNLLDALGIPPKSWYVCLHVRESGYAPSNVDKDYWHAINSCRNSTLSNTYSAVKFIQDMGGYVVRVGSNVVQKPSVDSNIINYSSSGFQNDKNDYLLMTGPKFILGSSSGLMAISGAQGVPMLLCNTVPLGGGKLWGLRDLSMPKLYYSTTLQRYLHFKEIFASGLANLNRCQMFDVNKINLIENSSEEILQATIELYLRINNNFFDESSDLLAKFNSFYSKSNYSYYSTSKVPSFWLKSHRSLIE
jgi:putative glycosyltransferase (TIGR04372 family)